MFLGEGGPRVLGDWLGTLGLVPFSLSFLFSPQGDSGEVGFPGMAGLFGPKVQSPIRHCSPWGLVHLPACSFIRVPNVSQALPMWLAHSRITRILSPGLTFQPTWLPRPAPITHGVPPAGPWVPPSVFPHLKNEHNHRAGLLEQWRPEAYATQPQLAHCVCFVTGHLLCFWGLSRASLDREAKGWPDPRLGELLGLPPAAAGHS